MKKIVFLLAALVSVIFYVLTQKDNIEIDTKTTQEMNPNKAFEKSSNLNSKNKVDQKKATKAKKVEPFELYEMNNNEKFLKNEKDVNHIIGEIGEKNYSFRVSKAANIDITKLDDSHVAKLHEYLFNPAKDDINENSIKTGLIDSFISNNHKLADFGNNLLIVIRDSKRSLVLRDYLLQFVPDYYEKRFVNSEEEDIILEKTEAKDTLLSIVRDTNSSLSGTALISFKRMVEIDSETFTRDELYKLARIVAKSPEHRNRATAVNLLGNSYEDLSVLEGLIYNDKEHSIVRISAMTSFSKKDLSEFPEIKQLFIEFMNNHNFKSERMRLIASASLKRVQ